MPELRKDPITGRWVIIATDRAKRPSDFIRQSAPPASAWSTTLSGCGIKGGAVHGKTDASGNRVADGEVNAAPLFATIYQALGISPDKNYYVSSRPVPLTEPGTRAIEAVLA